MLAMTLLGFGIKEESGTKMVFLQQWTPVHAEVPIYRSWENLFDR